MLEPTILALSHRVINTRPYWIARSQSRKLALLLAAFAIIDVSTRCLHLRQR